MLHPKKVQHDLQKNQKRYISLMDNDPDIVSLVNHAGEIVEINPAIEKNLGYRQEEVLNRSFAEFIAVDKQDEAFSYFQEMLQSTESLIYQIPFIHKDGHPVQLNVKSIPILENGHVDELFLIARDITVQKQAEEQLIKAKQNLIDTVRNQQGMTFKFKKQGDRFIYTLCDGELLYRAGLSPEQIEGKELTDIFPKEIATHKQRIYEQVWKSAQGITYEGDFYGIPYVASLRPIQKEGQVVEVIASCVDMTDKKITERALLESENKYRTLVEESLVGVYIIQDDKFSYVNPRMAEIYGYTQEELLHTCPLDYVLPQYKSLARTMIDRRHQGEKTPPYELQILNKQQTIVDLEIHGSPIVMNGKPATIGTLVDIRERKHHEKLMIKSEKLNAMGQLAAGVAHEIRNPLTSVKGFVQLLHAGEKNHSYFNIMLKELERINFIVDELLSLAKPQSVHMEEKDLKILLKQVVTLMDTRAIINNVELICDFNNAIPPIMCEENQLKQVFLNILRNSIEAMPHGGKIRILMQSQNNEVIIRIIDEGCGIPKELLPKLGEPYYTTKEKGTGLGLMVSYKIIDFHQGKISIDSTEGIGTAVHIILPQKRILDPDELETSTGPPLT